MYTHCINTIFQIFHIQGYNKSLHPNYVLHSILLSVANLRRKTHFSMTMEAAKTICCCCKAKEGKPINISNSFVIPNVSWAANIHWFRIILLWEQTNEKIMLIAPHFNPLKRKWKWKWKQKSVFSNVALNVCA